MTDELRRMDVFVAARSGGDLSPRFQGAEPNARYEIDVPPFLPRVGDEVLLDDVPGFPTATATVVQVHWDQDFLVPGISIVAAVSPDHLRALCAHAGWVGPFF
jgi:hypothetical protein